MTETFYPKISVEVHSDVVKVFTTLRKKHRGKWYWWRFVEVRKYEYVNGVGLEIERLLSHIHNEVYFALICGKVNPKLYINRDKTMPIFEKDPIQISEEERLKEKYHI